MNKDVIEDFESLWILIREFLLEGMLRIKTT